MKKVIYKSAHLLIISLAHLLIISSIFAQAPQKMSYQAIIRNSNDSLLISTPVGMRISLVQGSPTGTVVFTETQTATTNTNGLVSLQIGMGTAVSGTFASINWASGPYYVKTETDLAGGTNYTIISSNEILSVPYALFSANGTPGPQGPQGYQGEIGLTGPQGSNGLTALVKTTAELAGSNCATGGTKIETGLDVNNNGVLDIAEVNASQTTYVCNGLGGALSNGNAQGQTLFWNGSSWVNLAPGITGQTLNFCYNAPQWGPCLPLITTLDVSNITGYVASSGVTIIANGGYSITSAGICWSVNPNPTILDSINTNGNYSSTTALNLSNLIPGTTYYVRAYATNAGGTGYGNQLTFITGAALPTISTMTASNITFNSAIVGGNVSNDGGASVTSNGVCWSTSQNPTLVNSNLTIGQGLGSFNDTINGLSGNTTYYVRAFATNASGTAYGNQVSFNTYPTPSAQSCTGGFGGLSSLGSSLMNQQGFIIANIGQVVDLTMTLSYSTFNPCPGPNYSNACTNFFNPPEANLLTYNCGQQILSETISFNLSGTYNITGIGRSFFGQINTCNVSVYVP
ncbi:MAG: hypothetical protein EBU61_00755 [Crocinitomicaceae bacterium]|nr:hypothetical protein [Crocinitomicaceae bacterium]